MKWCLLLLLACACKNSGSARSQPTPAPATAPAARADAEAAAACPKTKPEGPLAWIDDDYPGALACARARHVPLVVDLWAPWCHTCLSMQDTVLQDPSFGADRDRFVFLALDTDKDVNAPALAKLAISAWPTFYVVDSAKEQVLARWIGAASLAQFHQLIDLGARGEAGGGAAADAHLLGANRALALRDLTTANQELEAALAAAPVAWVGRPELLGTLILTKARLGDLAGCLAVAEKYLDQTGDAAVASDFLGTAMSCADGRAEAEPARVKALRERAVKRWQELLATSPSALSIDDRCDAMASLRDALDALGRHDEAKALAEKERALLDDAAGKAKDPLAASTYNWPRAEVYVYLKRGLDLVPALEKSVQDLPNDYDPRSRLAWVYWQSGKQDLAAKWMDEALAMVYGPRKGHLLEQRADIAAAAGDRAAEKTFREQAVKWYQALPPGQQQPEALAQAQAALAALDAPKPAAKR